MATTQDELDLAFVEVGTQFKSLKTLIGLLASLSTTDKSSIISAINEVNAKTASAGAAIDDTTARSSTVYSSTKTDAQITSATAALKADILGGAGPTVDTLKEIADLLTSVDATDDSVVAALTTVVAGKLAFDGAQTLTAPQKVQVNTNAGSVSLVQFGDPAHSYKTVLLAALV